MGRNDMPCGNTAALNSYMRDQDRNEREWEAGHEDRVWEATESLTDADALKKVLNDEEFAAPLAKLNEARDRAIKSMTVLDLKKQHPELWALAEAATQLERVCFNYLMGDE